MIDVRKVSEAVHGRRKFTSADGENILWHAQEYLISICGGMNERAKQGDGEYKAAQTIRKLIYEVQS